MLAGSRANIGANVTTIGDLLNTAGVSWGEYYASGEERRAGMLFVPHHRYGTDWTYKYHTYSASGTTQFVTDAASCTSDSTCTCATNQTSGCLPSVVWVEAATGNEHPTGAMATGETWSVAQVSAVLNNPYLYDNTLIFLWWDDFGGFYDHMAPTVDAQNWRNGFRVPLLCIGRYCKNQVNHTEFTFESILAMTENMFMAGTRLPGSLYDSTATDIGMGCLQGTANCTGHTAAGMIDLTVPH
jgi:phospholipase C